MEFSRLELGRKISKRLSAHREVCVHAGAATESITHGVNSLPVHAPRLRCVYFLVVFFFEEKCTVLVEVIGVDVDVLVEANCESG